MMKRLIYILFFSLMMAAPVWGQVDRKDVRRGNRDFRKENYREADIDYRKALVKDSLSVAANYNLANTLYRQGDYAQAAQTLERIKDVAPVTQYSADWYFNVGDAALQQQDYQKAVEAFGESLIRRPDDLQAKENFIYAKKMLQNQQNQQQNQDNNQNQDNQNNDQNQDSQDDQENRDNDQQDDKDQENQDQNKDQNNQDDDQQKPQQSQGQQPKISPQAAQQMLQAIQAKEKETQDKVNKQKAEALKSRQKDKNW